MRITTYLLALSLGATLALTGCQTAIEEGQVGSGSAYWQSMKNKVNEIDNLLCRGKIGVISTQGRFSLNYVLDMQAKDEYTLNLTTALGSQAAVFKRDKDTYTLLADGKVEQGTSLAKLFAKRFATAFPEAEFVDIILAKKQEGMVFDEELKPLGLNLFPYQFLYSKYSSYQGLALPSEILMRSPELELKIVLNSVERI